VVCFLFLIFQTEQGKIALAFLKERLMQDNAMSKWLSPLMAFCVSFIIIATLAPITGIQIDRQLDFWLLWLATMLILALPLCYLEIALAKRSNTTALQALSKLTRDADASAKWRLAAWLAAVFIPFLVGGVLFNISQLLPATALPALGVPVVFVALAVLAIVLSFIPRQITVLLTAVGVLASLVLANVVGTELPAWHVTPVEFSEWGSATVLALVASGLGLGLYWQSSLLASQSQSSATQSALPIWFAQLLAVIAFGFFAVKTTLPAYALAFAATMFAGLLLNLAREQLHQRQIAMPIQWLVVLIPVFIWAIPSIGAIFNTVLILWGLLICLVYAVFVGWIMKISHLRKALNFSNEAFYNIWRIAVRIVIPLSIVLAIVAVLSQMF
jgi:SNF family Na+-dependent transporter